MTKPYIPHTGPIVNKAWAKPRRINRYFTGRPCHNDHISERRTYDGQCVECVRKKSRAKIESNNISITSLAMRIDTNNPYYTGVVIERDDAKTSGLILYFSGVACIHNHIAQRQTSSGMCVECYLSKIREYKLTEDFKKRQSKKKSIRRPKRNNKENRKVNPSSKVYGFTKNSVKRIRDRSGDLITTTITGYSGRDLVEHLSSLFTDGMTWDNYGDWHIDHVIPLSWHVDNGCTDIAVVNALSNLQPLWAYDNLSKGSRLDY